MTWSSLWQTLGLNSVTQCSWQCFVNAWNSQIWTVQQLDLLKAVWIGNRGRGDRRQSKRTPEQTAQASLAQVQSSKVATQCVYTGNGLFPYNSKIPFSLCFPTCLDIAKVMARLITLLCPGMAKGNSVPRNKDSSVEQTPVPRTSEGK